MTNDIIRNSARTLGVERKVFENSGNATPVELMNTADIAVFEKALSIPEEGFDILALIDDINEMKPGDMRTFSIHKEETGKVSSDKIKNKGKEDDHVQNAYL